MQAYSMAWAENYSRLISQQPLTWLNVIQRVFVHSVIIILGFHACQKCIMLMDKMLKTYSASLYLDNLEEITRHSKPGNKPSRPGSYFHF